jgi:16S rRNA (cytidine1402-2'-O)-methyltransferase
MTSTPGTLYVVATPIGNLEDLTFRALRVLREVDLIAAEDTRRSIKLLNHYEVRKPLVSLHKHNEARESPRLVNKLLAGQRVALVSDAGTPAISDPGANLVRAARDNGIPVVPIPGPSAITAALSVSGLESPEFVFMGFPPASGSARDEWFERAASEPRTIVFFEAPHRVEKTLNKAVPIFGNRPIVGFREISKIHESYVVYPNTDVASVVSPQSKGEFTIVIGPTPAMAHIAPDPRHAYSVFGQLTESAGCSRDDAVLMLMALFKVPARAVEKAIKKGRILVNQSRGSSA